MIEEVWNKGNFDVVDELFDEGFKSEDPVLGTVDRKGFLESVKTYRKAFPDLKVEIVSLVSDGNFVATRWLARGTNRGPFLGREPTGKATVTSGLDLAEVRNGKFVSDFNAYDSASLLRQLGYETDVTPPPEMKTKPETEKRS
jgi:steroid delta-isomerase-like uncharacterized protein